MFAERGIELTWFDYAGYPSYPQLWGDFTHGVTILDLRIRKGVRRNGGRVGAAQGPQAIRQALANLPVLGEPALWDMGDIDCPQGALEAAQKQADEIREMLDASFPLGLAASSVS